MSVRVSPDIAGNLGGYLVRPPDDTSLGIIKKSRKVGNEIADAILTCAAHTWTPGLQKWNAIRRIDPRRWSAGDLTKEVHFDRNTCEEVVAKAQYVDGYELTLVELDRLQVKFVRANKEPQVWHRSADIDDGALAAQKSACEKSRDAALRAYADSLPAIEEKGKVVSGQFWSGNGSLSEFQATQRLIAALKAAEKSLSAGAYRARQATRAIPKNQAAEVEKLRQLSDTAFEACKDVSP